MLRPEDIQQQLRKRPFEPFRIHLTDGTTHEVRHPDMVIVGERFIAVGVPRSPQMGSVADRIETAALMHIVRLEPIGTPASP
jgi:hypothetical protein